MKKPIILVLLLLLTTNQVFAIAPVNTVTIQAAQDYGRRQTNLPYAAFMAPWTSFEEKATKLDDSAEHAHIFTPYILVASDAREKALNGMPIPLEQSEKALAQYDGYLVFSITLHANNPASFSQLTAALLQDKKAFSPYYQSSASMKQMTIDDKTFTDARFYLYFIDKHVLRDKPVVIVITDSAKQTHSFFFDLDKVL